MFAKKEVAQARLKICKQCEHFTPGMSMCMICHCIMPIKTKIADLSCPISKWKEASKDQITLEEPLEDNCCPPDDAPIVYSGPGNNE